jgi:hypothetical protein
MSAGGRRLERVGRLAGDLRTMATMPTLDIVLSRGAPHEEEAIREFCARHPRYKLIGRKTLGVAVLPLEEVEDVESYLTGLRYATRRVRRASRLGYTVAVYDPDEHRSEILAVNRSLPERQGRPIESWYLDADAAYEAGPHVDYLGVFKDGAVTGYCELQNAGEIASVNRIMGHGDHLRAGIMFLLGAGIVEHLKAARPETRYLVYDMFFGASDGLREFKSHLGFRPYHVHWKRVVNGPTSPQEDA